MVKFQIYLIRWVERHTNLKCHTHRDMYNLLMNGKFTITYGDAIKNLYKYTKSYCKNKYILDSVSNLVIEINNSEIANLRFGRTPQRGFSDLEESLGEEQIKRTFYMITEMVSIKDVSELLGINEATIKQACQQERLLNTRKVGKMWLVHIPECRDYWNKKNENENSLYYNVEY